MSDLLEGCRRGNIKIIKAALDRHGLTKEEKTEALKTAAEYGQPDAFETVLLNHGQPDEETLLHAAKWALRYHDRRILGLVMQADTGRWQLPKDYLEELKALEMRHAKPDRVLLYLIERLFEAEAR